MKGDGLKINVSSADCVVGSGTEMMDGQLMGEFEAEAKELEADSWSLCVEQQYLQQLDKELVKRQDVIYGTSNHHMRHSLKESVLFQRVRSF